MELTLELNKKFGYGYQGRLRHGPMESVLDDQPYTLYEAGSGLAGALEEINKARGTNYQIHEVLRITDEALQVNKNHDLASAKLLKELRAGDYSNIAPRRQESVPRTTKKLVDGEEEHMLNMPALVCVTIAAWVKDKLPKPKEFLNEFCKLLAARKYGGSAAAIFAEVEKLHEGNTARWVEGVFNQCVNDDDVIGVWERTIGGVTIR